HFKPRSQGGSYASQISFVDDRPGHDFRYAIDPAKAERELDWAVRRALPGGLQETVSWYLEHPAWLVRPDAELRRLGLARGVARARITRGGKGSTGAGGTGARLYPMTRGFKKHLLPVYDKPMIYYPLTSLILGGIRDFVLVSSPAALPQFEALLGDGSQWGVSIRYLPQAEPAGIADGLRIAAPAVAGHNVAFMLGDNIFFGSGLGRMLAQAAKQNDGASVFVYEVANPEAFGTINLDSAGRAVSIVEKPKDSTSRYAVTGLYLYGPDVMEIAAKLSPSQRGELEITDVNRAYLEQGRLKAYPLGRGYAW